MSEGGDAGGRLAAESRWLRLLLAHLAGRTLRARVEIDDLAQDVFLRALSIAPGLPEERAALRRVLSAIARTAVIDAVRALRAAKRDGRREVRLVRTGSASGEAGAATWSAVPADTAGPATRAAMADDERLLLAAFERLDPEHRRVIGLRQFEGLSAAEAARRMGRSETAVHSLYRRALEAWARAAGG